MTMDQLRQDVGTLVEEITKVIATFRQFQLKMEEYVCLKVIAMVDHGGGKLHFKSMNFLFNFKMLFLKFCLLLHNYY